MAYVLGIKTCAEWLLVPSISDDIREVLQHYFERNVVVRAELVPESALLKLIAGDKLISVQLTLSSYAQHLGFYRYPVLRDLSRSWCEEARKKVAKLTGGDDTLAEILYYPDFKMLKVATTDPPNFIYVPNVVPVVE